MKLDTRGARQWLTAPVRYWAASLSVLILVFSSWQVANASSVSRAGEDCIRVEGSCRQMEQISTLKAQTYKNFGVLSLTDYAHTLSYKVMFQGELGSNTDTTEFMAQVAQSLADARGWFRAGYSFGRVDLAAQADFTLVLIQAELLNGIPGCDSNWSCRSGSNVYINENRWNGGTAAWNSAGGGLRDYRHMVVNHEVGHWLGLDHYNCADSPSNLAPVMQQQSIDLEGCDFNPWPLQFEIDSV